MNNPILPALVPKNDYRFMLWKDSLKKRPAPWNKGLNKNSDSRVKKISATMKEKKLNNAKIWREKRIKAGEMPSEQSLLEKNWMLAELIGLALGDGHIE